MGNHAEAIRSYSRGLQLTHNGSIIEATHAVYGRYRRARPAARFSDTKPDEARPSALYAEHRAHLPLLPLVLYQQGPCLEFAVEARDGVDPCARNN